MKEKTSFQERNDSHSMKKYEAVASISSKEEAESLVKDLAEEMMAWKFPVVPIYAKEAYRIAKKNVLAYASILDGDHHSRMEGFLGMRYDPRRSNHE